MITRARSLSGSLNRVGAISGESPVDVPNDTVLPVNSSPLLTPCMSGRLPGFGMSVNPVHVSQLALPHDRMSGPEAGAEAAIIVVRDLELRERELDLKTRELEFQRMKMEFERMSYNEVKPRCSMLQGETLGEVKRQSGSYAQSGHSLAPGVSLPRIEIPPYDGSPSGFWSFKTSFEVNIASKTQDDALRFSYLQYYCRGEAREAVNGCAILGSEHAYSEAWKILKSEFGRPHHIERALLKGLLEDGDYVETLVSLRSLARKMRECLLTLTQMGRLGTLDCSSNMLLLSKRLPGALQRDWAKRAGHIYDEDREPRFADLLGFVETCISAMDNIYGIAVSETPSPRSQLIKYQPNRVSAVVTTQLPACPWCSKSGHGLGSCRGFGEASPLGRRDFIRMNRRCFICLGERHFAIECKSNARCTVEHCNGRHHTLLHASPPPVSMKTSANVSTGRVRLGFIPVVLKGPNHEIVTNALVDNGSDVTLLSRKLARLLHLDGEEQVLNIRTLHGTQRTPSRRVTLQLCSTNGEFQATASSVFTIDNLPCTQVDRPLDLSRWSHLRDLTVETIAHDEIGILIGCDVPEAHWVLDQRIGAPDEPQAVQTPFGWTVRGNVGSPQGREGRVNFTRLETEPVEESLERMYESEFRWSEDGDTEAPSREDARALAIVERTTKIEEGRCEVGIPWKSEVPHLPDNRSMAEGRAKLLKRRLTRDENLLASYKATMGAYVTKGYVSLVEPENVCKRWYLPHHPVSNPKKPGKVRIVFDCAAKFRDKCLNDELLSGPNLNNDLAGVLLRFREGPVATAADIEEMFLRVKLPESDRWAFSFLWWTSEDLMGDPMVFQWNVHPFGAASSPFCAAYALRKVASTLPEPCSVIVGDNFYVDDCLLASSSTSVAGRLAGQLTDGLQTGGFNLTKWVSNMPESLILIREKDRLSITERKDLTDKLSHGTLGLLWDVRRDTIEVDLRASPKQRTKRGVLSCVASFFDPLGIIGPLLLPARKFLQRLCQQGLGWDTELKQDDQHWWLEWLDNLVKAPVLSVLRYPPQAMEVAATELHLFSDASETGYGAVAYLRVRDPLGRVSTHFVMGKSRVTPRKAITIPRLELTAAVLAVRLMKFINKESRLISASSFLWTDSTIVLHYLRNTTCRFKTFVANRVGYILEHSSIDQWRHVPTAVNPADLASRGMPKVTSDGITLWLKGPPFLERAVEDWPSFNLASKDISTDEEVRRVATTIVDVVQSNPVLSKLLLRYSTWEGLRRGVAWLRRFIRYVVIMRVGYAGYELSIGPLTVDELDKAERRLVYLIQGECFAAELAGLKTGLNGKVKTSLARLKPVLQDGIMCLGGRLPRTLIILPQRHPAVDRLIRYHHEVCGHMGASHVLANIRRKYWLVKGMASVRRIVGRCIRCRTASATPCEQVMASLPGFRVDEGGSPFQETGVDYFGPFEIKKGRTTHKRYGCLFTCMKTRAVHIEVAHDLSTDSFLMALIRFVGRRGVPVNIYSDNGSNFVGADADLRRQVIQLNQRQISAALTTKGITWHFNPPHASHRGGVWERMIRTTRRVLSAVVSNQALTEESLVTFMVETERLINDRPITPVYDDPTEPKALRPNDLLLLRSNTGIPTTEVTLLERYTKSWRQAQHLAAVFWKRWVREYVPTLQVGSRWNEVRREVSVGDLVLIIGGPTAYGRWPKGVVEEVKEGHDGHVRDVLVRTSTGKVNRDIRSVSLLEGELDV